MVMTSLVSYFRALMKNEVVSCYPKHHYFQDITNLMKDKQLVIVSVLRERTLMGP